MTAEIIYRNGTEGSDSFTGTRDKTVPQTWVINGNGGNDFLSAELIFTDDNFTLKGGPGDDSYGALIYGGKGTLIISDSTGNDYGFISLPAESFKAIANGLSVNKATGTINLNGSDLNIAIDARTEWVGFSFEENNISSSGYYLTEDLFKGIIRKATSEEMNFRTYGANQDWYLKNLDTASLWAKKIAPSYIISLKNPQDPGSNMIKINEENTLRVELKTYNLPIGKSFYYTLGGKNIDFMDFHAGNDTGEWDFQSNIYSGEGKTIKDYSLYGGTSYGSLVINCKIYADRKAEGEEKLDIKFYSDSAHTLQVGSTESIFIGDTSTAQPAYTLTPETSSVKEGEVFYAKVAGTNVTLGTTIYYSLSGPGINSSDFSSGALTGSGSLWGGGLFGFDLFVTIANDLTTEGTETLNIKLYSDSSRSTQVGSTASVSIADTSLGLTYYNPNTANTLTSWNIYRVDNSVKAVDIVSQWFGAAAPATTQLQDISETKLMDVAATWTDKVQINRVVKASDAGGRIEAKQIDFAAGEVAGSVISGGKGNDDIKGYAGWDNLEGGDGNDLIHGGNGRDIISGGSGRDELHGDFGWNTYRSEKDGVSDLIAIKSDHYLVNWLYGKAGNSPNGEKSDIIEGLDAIDKIKIIGIDTSEITFAANVITKGVTGIGIYGKGILEALYTGGDLTLAQIQSMTSGDASAAAMSNSVNSYGTW